MRSLFLSFLLLQTPTVAITLSSDTPAIVIPRSDAQAQFAKLCADADVTLVFDAGNLEITIKRTDAERLLINPEAPIDTASGRIKRTPVRIPVPEEVRAAAKAALAEQDQRLKALAAALNPMPDWPQFVMNGDASVCNRNPKPIVPVPLEKGDF